MHPTRFNNRDPVRPSQAAVDYGKVERAITYLQAHYLEQPDLRTVARAVHLSEYHFQRLFSRWAGLSPKRFLQFLTVEHAKSQLGNSKAVLQAALDSGLSSPSRLHDLFVSIEAVTPGEFKTRGAGIQINYGIHPTRFGRCVLGLTRRGVCWLSFVDRRSDGQAVRDLQSYWSGALLHEQQQRTAPVVKQIFSSLETSALESLSVLVMGTNFQIRVWQALLKIPSGNVIAYNELGAALGTERAGRAIGAAVGRNSVGYLIPCHRVIRNTGLPGGYRWGEPRKRAMLAWEAATSIQRTSPEAENSRHAFA
jgi:AraC family transcriptional regulator, regulatory protein of adaptative response / methylated-DNA-[protein]-cysteine methyltransferase